MKRLFFAKLALSGMRKNHKLYVPYLLTCIGMVMMTYIMQSLSYSPLLKHMSGGGVLEMILGLGKVVLLVFSVIFLMYTNSFLTKRRNREFGLYHILGMGKKGICRIIVWESLITGAVGLGCGMVLGIAFSKLAELMLAKIIRAEAEYTLSISAEAVALVGGAFVAVFLVLMINAFIIVYRTKPLELLHSDRIGEKPPKGNAFVALLGILILGAAYYIAVTIESPLTAIAVFFVAVIMVIIATYLLFISGSVVLCRILKNNKGYYYKKSHFVSVSSMSYRMKRNGAGLASICILSTMVLVMLTSSGSLYFGMESSLNALYEHDISMEVRVTDPAYLSDEKLDVLRDLFMQSLKQHQAVPQNITDLRYIGTVGRPKGNTIDMSPASLSMNDVSAMESLTEFCFIEAEEFNRLMNTRVAPAPGECYLVLSKCSFDDVLYFPGVELKVNGRLEGELRLNNNSRDVPMPYCVVAVNSLEELRPVLQLKNATGGNLVNCYWSFEYDLPGLSNEAMEEISSEQYRRMKETKIFGEAEKTLYSYMCRGADFEDFVEVYGGLFFIGIVLSLVFICAAVLIIYYKQICEGYEDVERFDILQKVGMTKDDIKKSINSQVLTVFMAPLVMAGLHLAFAYPLIWKILQMFYMRNLGFVITLTAVTYVVFGVMYALVYKLTAKAYYNVVS